MIPEIYRFYSCYHISIQFPAKPQNDHLPLTKIKNTGNILQIPKRNKVNGGNSNIPEDQESVFVSRRNGKDRKLQP